ncbi:hypothetical protein ARTHRO9AX_80095 [Arthrobacter sp. 9AX]|nr:hypothetical protein ARTHRO9AX_80095 [Arthrobacter sp. 9AX]
MPAFRGIYFDSAILLQFVMSLPAFATPDHQDWIKTRSKFPQLRPSLAFRHFPGNRLAAVTTAAEAKGPAIAGPFFIGGELVELRRAAGRFLPWTGDGSKAATEIGGRRT